MREVKIAPSLLSADFGDLANAARVCHDAGAEYLHFDVMDGQFVPNITFGPLVVKSLRRHSKAVFDVHLMIVHPEQYVENFAAAGSDIITVHAEACTHLQRVLSQIHAAGAKAGLALNPATPLNVLDYVLDDIDLLLIMTVNPGFSGQKFIPAMIRKIRDARKILDTTDHAIELAIDGGADARNAGILKQAGTSVIVAGSSVFDHVEGAVGGIHSLRTALKD